MKTTKKALLLALCAVLLVVASVLGTIAYLTDDEAVVNTFTVGKVGIKLDEADITKTDGSRTEAGNKYHLIPGQTYVKDPTVTVEAKSEASYVYMVVTVKNLTNLTAALPNSGATTGYYVNNIFLLQNLCDWQADSVWQYAGFQQNGNDGEYRFVYNGTPTGGDNGNKLAPLFTQITVPGEHITSTNIENLENVEINVTAYAVQAAGFDNFDAAWSASYGNNTNFTIE